MRRLVLLMAVGLASGCTATFQPMGPSLAEPRMAGTAAETAFVTRDGFTLPLRIWPAGRGASPRAVVLALHGFNDYSNCFTDAGAYFAARGITTYAYDQRGFGATRDAGIWAGAETLRADLKTAIGLVRAIHPGVPLYLMGESMGGAVVLSALASADAPAVTGTILVAPAVWGLETMDFLPRAALWLSYNTLPGWVVHPPSGLGIKPSDNIEMLRALGRDPLAIKGARVDALWGLTELMGQAYTAAPRLKGPALVLYGAHEQVLPAAPVESVMGTFTGKQGLRVAVYPNGYHMLLRDLQREVVMADIIHWIDHPTSPLLSGADQTPRQLLASR